MGRIILTPFMVAALLIDFPMNAAVALLLFVAASVTDLLDGKIARRNNLITDFGKFADPLADKILVLAALLCFVQNGWCDCVAVIIVLFREFAVTSIRLIAAAKGSVIAANIFGKIKTVTQMTAIITVMVMQSVLDLLSLIKAGEIASALKPAFFIAGELLIWVSTVFAIISGVIYVVSNKKFISEI